MSGYRATTTDAVDGAGRLIVFLTNAVVALVIVAFAGALLFSIALCEIGRQVGRIADRMPPVAEASK